MEGASPHSRGEFFAYKDMKLIDIKKINKLSLPAVILIASVILGASYCLVKINEQNSIERQQETKIADENRNQSE